MFHDETLIDNIHDMIIPVSIGKKTVSLTVREFLHLLNEVEDDQNARLDEQYALILQNTDLINQLSDSIIERIAQLKEDASAEHQQMIETQQVVDTAQDERLVNIETVNPWEIID